MSIRTQVVGIAAIAGGVIASSAFAATTASDPYVVVNATSGPFSGSYSVPLGDVTIINEPDMDIFFWQTPTAVPILDGSNVVATLVSMTVLAGRNTLPSGEVRYGIDIDYQVLAGSNATTFELLSPTLFFDAILNGTALSSATLGGTDQNNNGITITPGLGSGFAYQAMFNGSSLFTNYFNSVLANPAASGSVGDAGNPPIPGVFTPIGMVSSMRAQLQFTVSAGDSAAGTSTFGVAPAPGAAALLGVGGLFLGRRRR